MIYDVTLDFFCFSTSDSWTTSGRFAVRALETFAGREGCSGPRWSGPSKEIKSYIYDVTRIYTVTFIFMMSDVFNDHTEGDHLKKTNQIKYFYFRNF